MLLLNLVGYVFKIYCTRIWKRRYNSYNVVAPGLTETDANRYMPQEAKQQIASLTAIGRVGKPEDVAGVVGHFLLARISGS